MTAIGDPGLPGKVQVRDWFAATRPRGVWAAIAGVVLLVLFALVVLPLLAPYGSTQVINGAQLSPPSSHHFFGTDINEMDVFSRVLVGTRIDVGIAFAATAAAFGIGFPLGIVSGYFSGPATILFLRILDMVQAFPVLILALAIVSLLGGGIASVVYAAIFVAAPIMVRVVRSVTVQLREERFIESAVATGNSDARVLIRHVAPHALPVALIESTIIMSGTLILVTGLSFIGLGVSKPTAEWGSMLGVGSRDIVNGEWWTIVFPGLAIALTIAMMNLLGQLLQRAFGGHRN